MDGRTVSTAGAGVCARVVATVAVLFAALVLFTPPAMRAATTSAHEAVHHPASAVTVLAADKHLGTLRLDLPQLPAAPPSLVHQARAALHTADSSSTTLATTADSHRTRGPPPDDRS
jgi:hypothetical protein